jgi:hypothetical protein
VAVEVSQVAASRASTASNDLTIVRGPQGFERATGPG